MAIILNIETSTEVCSVNISRDGEQVILKENTEGLRHSELLTVYIEELMAEGGFQFGDLDAVAVSKGPGSYTGLRIGVSVAKGICYGTNIPLISVDSLEVIGKHSLDIVEKARYYCPMIDARRMEVYTALYNENGGEILPVSAEIVDENFLAEQLNEGKVVFMGNGAEKCKPVINHPNAVFSGLDKTSAQFMQKLSYEKYNKGQFEDLAYFEPFYLKDFVATIPKNKVIK